MLLKAVYEIAISFSKMVIILPNMRMVVHKLLIL